MNVSCPVCGGIGVHEITCLATASIPLKTPPYNSESQLPETLTQEAERLIQGERRGEYGPAKQSFQNIADTWNAHLRQLNILKDGCALKGQDVAILMAAFKLLRHSAKPKRDNLVDAIGYELLSKQCEE